MGHGTRIKFYGSTWCPSSRRARKLLIDKGVPFEWINIDNDLSGREYVMKVNNGYRSVPTILFPDGDILVEPTSATLLEKLRGMGFLI